MKSIREGLKIIASISGIGTALFCMIYFNTEIHKICPFATVCTGPLSLKLHTVIFGTGISIGVFIIVAGYFTGRLFCGYICPIGLIQKLSDFISEKARIKKITVTQDKSLYLYILKYAITFKLITMSLAAGSMIFIEVCPIYMFSSLPYLGISLIAVGSITLIFIISLKIKYFFCRFICPYSVFIETGEWIMRTLGIKKIKSIKREENLCINCGICDERCPVENEISKMEEVESVTCIKCMKCIDICPMNKKGKKSLIYK